MNDAKYEIGISEKHYQCKPSKTEWSKQVYHKQSITIEELRQLISLGYNFCHIFGDERVTIKSKTNDNFKSANLIFIDVDNSNISMAEYVEKLSNKPTLYYTTPSNKENDYRFRLVYIFNEPINSIEEYKNIYTTITQQANKDTNTTLTDNCCISPSQQIGGSFGTEVHNTATTYSKSDFNGSFSVDSNIYKETTANNYEANTNEIKAYMCDFANMGYEQLIEKYNHIYPSVENTQIDQIDNNLPYIILPSNYITIKRYWIYDIVVDDNNEEITRNQVVRKIKDGEKRRKKLFVNALIRRKIKNDINIAHLLHNLVNELYFFIDNRNDSIKKQQLYNIAKNAMKANINNFQPQTDKRSFVINEEYCRLHNITKKKALALSRKIKKYNEIGNLFDGELTDKENLKIINESGIKCSIATLKRFRKDNGIAKYNKEQKKEFNTKKIINNMAENIITNELKIYEENKIKYEKEINKEPTIVEIIANALRLASLQFVEERNQYYDAFTKIYFNQDFEPYDGPLELMEHSEKYKLAI